MNEQRQNPRIPINIDVEITANGRLVVAKLDNISDCGCFILMSDMSYGLGMLIGVQVKACFADGSRAPPLWARVVRHTSKGFALAFEAFEALELAQAA